MSAPFDSRLKDPTVRPVARAQAIHPQTIHPQTIHPIDHGLIAAPGPRWNRQPSGLPAYMVDRYYWAYINPRNVWLLDRQMVVNAILLGNGNRLQQAALCEVTPGQRVLMPAHVYGDFIPALAHHLGSTGHLDVVDIVPVQVENCRQKLAAFPNAVARLADAADPGTGLYDAVVCFFLLHELPDEKKRAVVDSLLTHMAPGGKVIFVDYHRPARLNPFKWLIGLIFDTLEPFARGMWRHDICEFATHADDYTWRTETYFGGLYQKTVAQCRPGK